MRLRAGRRREKREDEGGKTPESPRFSFGGLAAAPFSSSSSPASSSEPSLPRAFADSGFVSSLEPALTAAKRSSDNLFELVKTEREKIASSIRSAAAAAAASPFAPVSLDDFGGEAWRNATTSLAFFGGKAAAAAAAAEQQQKASSRKKPMNNNSKTSNRRQASSSSPSSSSQPPQFGLDVFSALNESVLMRGSSSSGSRQLKSQVRRRNGGGFFGCFLFFLFRRATTR